MSNRHRANTFVQSLAATLLGLAVCVGGAQAQTGGTATDLAQLITPADALPDGWSLASQGPETALAGFPPKPVASYGARYEQAPLVADVALYKYADRATALASPGFSDQSIYWGHGNTIFVDLSGFGDGKSYRAYPPGKGAASGITFVDGTIVVFVRVDGFDTGDAADALANQLASAEDAVLQTNSPAPAPSAPAPAYDLSPVQGFSRPVLIPPPDLQPFASLPFTKATNGKTQGVVNTYSVVFGNNQGGALITGTIGLPLPGQSGPSVPCPPVGTYCYGAPNPPTQPDERELFLGLQARGENVVVGHSPAGWWVTWYDRKSIVSYEMDLFGTDVVSAYPGTFSETNMNAAQRLAALADQLVPWNGNG